MGIYWCADDSDGGVFAASSTKARTSAPTVLRRTRAWFRRRRMLGARKGYSRVAAYQILALASVKRAG